MLTTKQYDILSRLNDAKDEALENLYHGSGKLTDRAFDFAEANQEFEAYMLSLTDTESKEDDGWIEWVGGECPVETGTLVDVRYRDGVELYELPANKVHPGARDAQKAFWRNDSKNNDIIAYRIVRN